jgi:hypothetical protein
VPKVKLEGCESGRIGTPGERVWSNPPWVQIPLPPPTKAPGRTAPAPPERSSLPRLSPQRSALLMSSLAIGPTPSKTFDIGASLVRSTLFCPKHFVFLDETLVA